MIKEYIVGFKKIFTNAAAALVLVGIICRIWETAISSNFLSAYMKCYTDDVADEHEVWQNQWYPSLVSGAVLIGSVFSNVMSAFVIGLFDAENPMAIPYVVAVRHIIDIPCLYMIFINQNQFWVAIAGYYCQQLFAKGWTAPALLMLKSVVDKEVSSLSIGIFLFTVNIDYSFALGAAGSVKSA